MSTIQHITNHPDVASPSGLYSLAVRVPVGDLVFVSGQTASDKEGNRVGEGDITVQARQVFNNLGNVLSAAGTNFENVIEFTTYIVGDDSVGPFLDTRAEIFRTIYPDGRHPCSTLVNVSSLGGGDALVEISAIAIAPTN
tara:strand:- start:206 stop:625 length:420 start_codon:yes stop_codon:yes gene_type:complete